MKKRIGFGRMVFAGCALLLVVCGGCTQQEASEAVKKAETAAEETAQSIADDVGQVVDKGREMAGQLSDKAMAFMAPMKEKFANLDSLKDSPDELKKAVTDLIASIENKAGDLQLPEAVSNSLAKVKEKLVALKDYLQGEVDEAKIEEHIKGIMDTVKSGLGMS